MMEINETTALLLLRDIKNRLLYENVFWVGIDKLIDLLRSIITCLDQFHSNKPVIRLVYVYTRFFQPLKKSNIACLKNY